MLTSELHVVSVHLPPLLRCYAKGHDEVMGCGETVGDVLEAVSHTFPALQGHMLCRGGELAAGLQVYLGGRLLATDEALCTPVDLEDGLWLLANEPPCCAPPILKEARRHRDADVAEGAISIGVC